MPHNQGMKIRHHGDFHLGQVLIAKDDAYILDFEGETRRTLEERRGKEPPARDVAGFLRSIDYAVSAALSRVPQSHAGGTHLSLTERTHAWGDKLATSYWRAIAKRSALRRCGRRDEAVTRAVAPRFMFEKALYEVEYDVGNRPTWAHIPIRGGAAHVVPARCDRAMRNLFARRARNPSPVMPTRSGGWRRHHSDWCIPLRSWRTAQAYVKSEAALRPREVVGPAARNTRGLSPWGEPIERSVR